MAGRYKVDVLRHGDVPRRRSSHKTLDDAVLQSRRSLKKERNPDTVFQILLDGVVVRTVMNEET